MPTLPNIDLGDSPVGTWPTTAQQIQIRSKLEAAHMVIPFNLGSTLSGTAYVLALSNGVYQYGTVTGDIKFALPSGTAVEGDFIKVYLLASGVDRELDFVSTIKLPSESTLGLPKTMSAGKTYVFQLGYTHGSWCLISLVGGY